MIPFFLESKKSSKKQKCWNIKKLIFKTLMDCWNFFKQTFHFNWLNRTKKRIVIWRRKRDGEKVAILTSYAANACNSTQCIPKFSCQNKTILTSANGNPCNSPQCAAKKKFEISFSGVTKKWKIGKISRVRSLIG